MARAAVYKRDGGSARARNFVIALVMLGIGYGQMEAGDTPIIGLIVMMAGAAGILGAVFNPWVRKY